MDFATVFKLMCKEKGVTQKQALADMNLGRNAAQRWINGWPSYETLSKISAHFSVQLDDMTKFMETDDEAWVASFLAEKQKKPAEQVSGLRGTGYENLTPENQKVIDAMIDALLKGQSDV